MFKGSFTALITPFRNGKIDEDAFRRLVEWQISGRHARSGAGRHDRREPDAVPRRAQAHRRADGRDRQQARARDRRRRLERDERGDRLRRAMPRRWAPMRCSWSRPTTTSRRKRASSATSRRSTTLSDIPIFIYNIPGRSVVDMSVETMARCFALKNVVGVKDATANLARASQQRAAMGRALHHALGRGRDRAGLHGARRPRVHLGHLQRRPAVVRRFPERVP